MEWQTYKGKLTQIFLVNPPRRPSVKGNSYASEPQGLLQVYKPDQEGSNAMFSLVNTPMFEQEAPK